MKKVTFVLSIILASLVTSCTSYPPAVPKTYEGSFKIFTVSSNGTIKVKGVNLKDQPTHWVFVHCAHWSGCYMRCQGPIKTCKKIAKQLGLKVSHSLTRKKNKSN